MSNCAQLKTRPAAVVNINGGFIQPAGGASQELCQIGPHGKPVDPTWYCDPATQEITGGIVWNLTCDGIEQIYLDPAGELTSVAPEGVICSDARDYEYKNITFCLTDGEGAYYQKELCRTFMNDMLVSETITFHYPDGSQSPDPPVGVVLIPCEVLTEESSIIDLPLCDPGV